MKAIDISHHNGQIDFSQVKEEVDFIYIKASEGISSTDPKFYSNAKRASEAVIPIGYYHFATLNNEDEITDAKKEAEWFIHTIKQAPAFQLPLVLDIEDDSKKVDLDPNEVLAWVNTFFATLEANGFTNYALYSYTPFLISRLPKGHNLGSIRLWIAAYTKLSTPKLPPEWSSYWLWQHSAKGQVKGINTPVDMNKSNFTSF